MSTRRWMWLISLPNQSKVQHFELSGICSSMIVLRYANKGESIFWSTISKVCFVVKYTFKGGNRQQQQMNFISSIRRGTYHILRYQSTHLESSVAHGGAPIQIAHGGAFDINQTKSDLLMEAISISFYSYSHTYHTWSWKYVRCSITGDIQEMPRLSCLLQINSETTCIHGKIDRIEINHDPKVACNHGGDGWRTMRMFEEAHCDE